MTRGHVARFYHRSHLGPLALPVGWQAEQSNAENLLIIDGKPKLAGAYAKNFEHHLGHSKPYAK